MPYINKRRARRQLMGLGAFDDNTQCSQIPIGDPYRKPGNYCATPDGGTTTFNSDGSTYRAPGAVDPDPAHPASSSSGGGFWGAILGALAPAQTTSPPIIAPQGMSTTTKLALAGGAVAIAILLIRR